MDIPLVIGPRDSQYANVLGKIVVDRVCEDGKEEYDTCFSRSELDSMTVLVQIIAQALQRAKSRRKAMIALAGQSAHMSRSKVSGAMAYIDDILDGRPSVEDARETLVEARIHLAEVFHELNSLVVFTKLPHGGAQPQHVYGHH
jgi:hypothetical protein